jgi:hypothetical protein
LENATSNQRDNFLVCLVEIPVETGLKHHIYGMLLPRKGSRGARRIKPSYGRK